MRHTMSASRWKTVLLVCVGLSAGARAAGAAEPWWDARWEYRLPVVVRETQGVARAEEPVVLTGAAIAPQAMTRGIRIGSIRVVCGGRETPYQVDEKDGTGFFLTQGAGDGLFGKDDELLFRISLAPRAEKTCYLYFETLNAVPEPLYPTGLRYREYPADDREVEAELTDGNVAVGIRGQHASARFGGLGKGTVTRFLVRGRPLVTQGPAWGIFLLRSPFDALPWGDPVLLSRGPVRVMAAAAAYDIDWTGPGGRVRGRARRHFALYAGTPLVTVHERTVFSDGAKTMDIRYENLFYPGGIGRDWVNERMCCPDGKGGVRTVDCRGPVCSLPAARESWAAFRNEKTGLGLAFFAPPGAALTGRLYQSHVKFEELMKHPGGGAHSTAECSGRLSVGGAAASERTFGFLVLDGEDGPAVRNRYRALWEAPLGRGAAVGELEARPASARGERPGRRAGEGR